MDDFRSARGYNRPIPIAEHIDVDQANDYAGKARKLALPTVFDVKDQIFPSDLPERDVIMIGAGPSLNKHLQEVDQRDGFKVLSSMAVRLLKKDGLNNGVNVIVLGCYNAERIQALKQGGEELLERLQETKTKILVPTYMQDHVFDYLIEGGVKDNLVLWEPDFPGAIGAQSPTVFPGSTGVNAALSLLSAVGAKKFEFYGVDTSGPAIGRELEYTTVVADLEKTYQGTTQEGIAIQVGDTTYYSTRLFWETQTVEMQRFLQKNSNIEIKFHGDHVNSAIFNHNAFSRAKVLDRNGQSIEYNMNL